eukprot:4189844-Alexandrium_andersonii.AAC.1
MARGGAVALLARGVGAGGAGRKARRRRGRRRSRRACPSRPRRAPTRTCLTSEEARCENIQASAAASPPA